MKTPATLLLCLIAVPGLSACSMSWTYAAVKGSGVSAEEIRELPQFNTISLRTAADVTVDIGPATSIVITSDDNLIPLLETYVQGNELVIKSDKNFNSRIGMNVRVTTPALDGFRISGSGDVVIQGVDASLFDAAISGSGTLRARGRVGQLEASISGSGDMLLADLRSREADVKISGSGDMEINVEEALRYRISGSGDIRYHGGARTAGKVSGSGSIRPVGGGF